MYLHRSGKVSSAVTISQYHSLSYGKIEKLPEVENKTQQCHSFNTKKTKLLSGLVHDFAFYQNFTKI